MHKSVEPRKMLIKPKAQTNKEIVTALRSSKKLSKLVPFTDRVKDEIKTSQPMLGLKNKGKDKYGLREDSDNDSDDGFSHQAKDYLTRHVRHFFDKGKGKKSRQVLEE